MGLLQQFTTIISLLAAGLPLCSTSPIQQQQGINIQSPDYADISRSRALVYERQVDQNIFTPQVSVADGFWLNSIPHRGSAPYNPSGAGYQVFRNVKDFGARGDGVTDDTAAINAAISSGARCGQGCDSSTVSPAVVYFPPGTYVVSTPIIIYYYTQLVGSVTNRPTLKASSNFQGIAVLDSNPYGPGGVNWYTNQNNFFKAVRNFYIDLTGGPGSGITGIHWQVAQATSLFNIDFILGTGSQHQGIFMENGSGGWLSDLRFNGGKIGMTIGNQQFTTRNLVFNNCATGINMLWDWAWTFKTAQFNHCGVGIDLSNGQASQNPVQVGSAILLDCTINSTPIGIKLARTTSTTPSGGGSLIIDNLYWTNVAQIVKSPDNSITLAGGAGAGTVQLWGTGAEYTASSSSNYFSRTSFPKDGTSSYVPQKPQSLRWSNSATIFESSRPQYEKLAAGNIVSAKGSGCAGNGNADDWQCLQNLVNANVNNGKVIYLDHGIYRISRTLVIPSGVKITGEAWSVIMGFGGNFQTTSNPQPIVQVGQKGAVGCVELSDLIVSSNGNAPGAVGIEWNLGQKSQGCNGMWDVHVRIGGSAGTGQQDNVCTKNPNAPTPINPNCITAFMLVHITSGGSVYCENNWFWTSDHDLDSSGHNQISLYSGRGLLVEGNGPVWLYGTAAEHNQLYNYQFSNAANVFAGMIQSETPYMAPSPRSTAVFPPQSSLKDPTFSNCSGESCYMAWGLRVVNSHDILVYGAGLYSFFSNYGQSCIDPRTCQQSMVSLDGTNRNVVLYNLNTIGTATMLVSNGVINGGVSHTGNPSVYGDVVALIAKGN